MHLCSNNLRIGILTDGNFLKVENGLPSGPAGGLFNKLIFSKSHR